jgi:Uma2 family endonuclease
MTTAPATTVFRPEDLLALPDEGLGYELVGGRLVARHSGPLASAVAANIGAIIGEFVRARRDGHVFDPSCGYQCFADAPSDVRKADFSFVRAGRLPGGWQTGPYVRVAPDLVVEVVAPRDLACEVEGKVEAFLGAGARLVWSANPKTKTVRILRPAAAKLGPIGTVSGGDPIDGEEVLPGFECRVAEFFEI